MDAAGNAYAAWGEGGKVIASASLAGSKVWSAPVNLNTTGDFNSWAGIDVAATSAGNALVGMHRSTDSAALPIALSGNTLVPGTLKTFASGNSLPGPVLSIAGERTLAVWVANDTISSQWWDLATWSTPSSAVSSGLSYYSNVTVATNAKGQAVMAWRDRTAGGVDSYTGVVMSSFWNGSSWSAPELISLGGPVRKCWWLASGIDDVGHAVVSWADFDEGGTYTRIWANVVDFGSGTPKWRAPEPIDVSSPGVYLADKPENVRDITVVMEPNGGGAYVTYIQHGAGSDPTSRTYGTALE